MDLSKPRLITGPLRKDLKRVLRQKPVTAAVAYVSDVRELSLTEGDRLICDATTGATQADALRSLLDRNVKVCSLPGLHAKLVVAGKTALIGSANWSVSSEEKLVEATVELTDSKVVANALKFIEGLFQRQQTEEVDYEFLNRMPKMPIRSPVNPDREGNYWLISVKESNRQRLESENFAERLQIGVPEGEISFIRYAASDKFAPKLHSGDYIILIYRDQEAAPVYRPMWINEVRRLDGGVSVFYTRYTTHEDTAIAWNKFKNIAAMAHLPLNISKKSQRQLTKAQVEALVKKWPTVRGRG